MKKIAAMILLALMALSIPVSADGFDFSEMSDEELLSFIDAANEEAEKRGLMPFDTIVKGTYEVGVDIRSGSYELTCLRGDEEEYYNKIWFYESYEDCENMHSKDVINYSEGDSLFLRLTDGEVFKIDGGEFSIKESKPFYAP